MKQTVHLYIAGDSTAAPKAPEKRPETGWGEKFSEFLREGVEVLNFAANGRSSKSFIDEGRLEKIKETLGRGDILLIQFGHNDEKEAPERHTGPFSTYQDYLTQYVHTAWEHAAFPVLLTPVQRREFDAEGRIINSHGEYPVAMKALGARLNVPVVDMTAISTRFFESLGPEKSKEIFLWVKPGHPNYPAGVQDNTHFCEYGAREIARLAAEALRKVGNGPIRSLIR